MYDMPEEIDVKADGSLRIITLNRPDALNAVNDALAGLGAELLVSPITPRRIVEAIARAGRTADAA